MAGSTDDGSTLDWGALLLQLRIEDLCIYNVDTQTQYIQCSGRPLHLISPVEPDHPLAALAAVEIPMRSAKMSVQQRQDASGVMAVGRPRYARRGS